MSGTTRRQAPRLARPAARYWKGKAPKGVAEAESDSDEEIEEQSEVEEEGDVDIGGEQDIVQDGDEEDEDEKPQRAVKTMNIALKDVDISKDGRVTVAGREESGRTEIEEEEESSEEESSEEEEDEKKADGAAEDSDSSEYESSSEEEQPKVQFRPVFVPKGARATIAKREAEDPNNEEVVRKRELEAEERRKQSHDLVAETIRRELAEKEKEEETPDVDDTDGLDPAAEFEAWRLRELARIKKEKEDEVRREKEREEIERRRALPEAQRMQEDMEHAQKSREEKPKGQQKFLQKYWHKGAFHQDEEILKRHDYTEATDSQVDISLLPKVMQVKDFGKRGRTKYTHLADQDTTKNTGGFGGTGPVRQGGSSIEGGGCFLCGGPHLKKDCPQNTGPLTERGGPPRTGANAGPSGSRKWGGAGSSESWRGSDDRRSNGYDRPRDRDRDGRRDDRSYNDDSYSRRRNDQRRRSYSHSRSPPPKRREKDYHADDYHRKDRAGDYQRQDRRRSRERSIDSDHREKRRRLD